MEKIIGNLPHVRAKSPSEFHECRSNEVEDVTNSWTNLISGKVLDTTVLTMMVFLVPRVGISFRNNSEARHVLTATSTASLQFRDFISDGCHGKKSLIVSYLLFYTSVKIQINYKLYTEKISQHFFCYYLIRTLLSSIEMNYCRFCNHRLYNIFTEVKYICQLRESICIILFIFIR